MKAKTATCLHDITKSRDTETELRTFVHNGASYMHKVSSANSWADVGYVAHKLHLCHQTHGH